MKLELKIKQKYMERIDMYRWCGKDNPMYGIAVIHNVKTGETKSIPKAEYASTEFKLENPDWAGGAYDKSGKNNPTYGKRWLYNVVTRERKYINIEQLIEFIYDGSDWILGIPEEIAKKCVTPTSVKKLVLTKLQNRFKTIDFSDFDITTYISEMKDKKTRKAFKLNFINAKLSTGN